MARIKPATGQSASLRREYGVGSQINCLVVLGHVIKSRVQPRLSDLLRGPSCAISVLRSRGVGDSSSLDLAERVSWVQSETLSLTIQKGIEIAPRRYYTAIAESVGKLDDP